MAFSHTIYLAPIIAALNPKLCKDLN